MSQMLENAGRPGHILMGGQGHYTFLQVHEFSPAGLRPSPTARSARSEGSACGGVSRGICRFAPATPSLRSVAASAPLDCDLMGVIDGTTGLTLPVGRSLRSLSRPAGQPVGLRSPGAPNWPEGHLS